MIRIVQKLNFSGKPNESDTNIRLYVYNISIRNVNFVPCWVVNPMMRKIELRV